jgi:hypothetical protein
MEGTAIAVGCLMVVGFITPLIVERIAGLRIAGVRLARSKTAKPAFDAEL